MCAPFLHLFYSFHGNVSRLTGKMEDMKNSATNRHWEARKEIDANQDALNNLSDAFEEIEEDLKTLNKKSFEERASQNDTLKKVQAEIDGFRSKLSDVLNDHNHSVANINTTIVTVKNEFENFVAASQVHIMGMTQEIKSLQDKQITMQEEHQKELGEVREDVSDLLKENKDMQQSLNSIINSLEKMKSCGWYGLIGGC